MVIGQGAATSAAAPRGTANRGAMRTAFLILSALLSSGCLATAIPPPELNPAIARLERTADRAVGLSLVAPPGPLKLGHQYLGIAVPFGSIISAEPAQALERVAKAELALAGIRTTTPGRAPEGIEVTFELTDAAVTAYDLLVVRRISARATVRVRVASPHPTAPPRAFEATGESGTFARFGFAPELTAAFNAALEGAIRSAVLALQSSSTFRYDAPSGRVRRPTDV